MRRSRLNGRRLRTPGSPSINPFESLHTPHSPFGEAITRFTQINGTELPSMGFPRQFAVKRTYRVMILSIGGRLGLRRRLTAKFLWWKLLFCCTISVFVIIWVLNLDLKSKKGVEKTGGGWARDEWSFRESFDKAFSKIISRKLQGFSEKGILCNFITLKAIFRII